MVTYTQVVKNLILVESVILHLLLTYPRVKYNIYIYTASIIKYILNS